jgi:alpha-tubulin suppressor-like RCC1 family protein
MWGNNNYGQLGDETKTLRNSPVEVVGATTDWEYVSCARAHTAAIKTDGSLWSWGLNTAGQLGIGILGSDLLVAGTSSPVQISGGGTWDKLATGFARNTGGAVKDDGTLWVWGDNTDAQLSYNANDTNTFVATPRQTAAGSAEWQDISFGNNHTQAIGIAFPSCNVPIPVPTPVSETGKLWGWGDNSNKQLGLNNNIVKYPEAMWVWALDYDSQGNPYRVSQDYNTVWDEIAAGYLHSLFIDKDGELWSVGSNTFGQLGYHDDDYANTLSYNYITQVPNNDPVKWQKISAGALSSYAIKQNGSLWVWGDNSEGQLGTNSTVPRSSPIQTSAGGNIWTHVASQYQHVAAIKSDGSLWTWGLNSYGQLGDETTTSKSIPTNIGTDKDWSNIACGKMHTAAIKTDGTLWTWGSNTFGELGDDTTNHRSSPAQEYSASNRWIQVACGYGFTVALKNDKSLWAWGYNGAGQLGLYNNRTTKKPTEIYGNEKVWIKVACGAYNTAAIRTNGSLWSWGTNSKGQIGDDTLNPDRSSPVQVLYTGNDWADIKANGDHLLGLREPYVAPTPTPAPTPAPTPTYYQFWAWGENSTGRLADNTVDNRSSPVQNILGGNSWSSISNGNNFGLALKSDNTLWAAGSFYADGFATKYSKLSPMQIETTRLWAKISAGYDNYAAITADNQLFMAGTNFNSECGQGDSNPSSPMRRLSLVFTKAQEVSVGFNHTLAVREIAAGDKTLWAWGDNSYGQLGNQSVGLDVVSRPEQIGTDSNWNKVATGYGFSAAIKTDGTLWTWGKNNYGQMGDTSVTAKSSPVKISNSRWFEVSCGENHVAAIDEFNNLYVWGLNEYGSLGLNTAGPNIYSSPVQTIAGGSNWEKVSCGRYFTAATKTDGSLWTWGKNQSGEAGIDDDVTIYSPEQVGNTEKYWQAISTKGYATYGLVGRGSDPIVLKAGSLWGWGNNNGGRLGDGTIPNKSSPVQTSDLTSTWVSVSAGQEHGGGIKENGTLWMWGRNLNGQLGDFELTPQGQVNPQQTIIEGNTWSQISCGDYHTAAIQSDRSLWVWGYNSFGQLGNGYQGDVFTPEKLDETYDWKFVNCGSNHTAAIKNSDSSLWLWGANTEGQLGNSSTDSKSSPIQIMNGSEWNMVACGYAHTAAINAVTQELWVWGMNYYGQLGIGNTTGKSEPVLLASGEKWSQACCIKESLRCSKEN